MVKERPTHLELPLDIERKLTETLPSIHENVFDEADLDDLDDYVPDKPATRSARTREYGDAPPRHQDTREDDLPSTAGDEVRSGIGEYSLQQTQKGDRSPTIREAWVPSGPAEPDGSSTPEGDAPPEAEQRQPLREKSPENMCDTRGRLNLNNHMCKTCATLIKLVDGRCICVHKTKAEDLSYRVDATGNALDLLTNKGQLYGTIAYVRGLQNHPLRETVPFVAKLERALDATNTMLPPSRESTSEEESPLDSASHESESDDDDIPPYRVLAIEPVGDAPPTHNTQEGDAPPQNELTCEDDLPSTEGDKVCSGIGENSPEHTQEDDVPSTAGDKVRSGLGESSPETTHRGDQVFPHQVFPPPARAQFPQPF